METYDKKLHFSVPDFGNFFFGIKIQDSRHFQLAIYTVCHEESESAVRIDRFLHPEEKIVCASRIPPRQLAAGTRRPGGSDVWRLRSSLILAASWISLMASGELPKFLFCKKIMIIEHNSESITLGWSWGLLGAILKPFRRVLGSPGAVWEALGVVLGALGAVLGPLGAVLWRHVAAA